jgi:hypothetical protein
VAVEQGQSLRRSKTQRFVSPLSAHADAKTQRFVSTLAGITAGGLTGGSEGARIGSDVALSAEIHNRQLHQREIALINANAADFAKQKGITLAKAKELLAQAALHNVDSWYAGLSVDPDAQKFIANLAAQNGGTFKDNLGRTQHLFDERDNPAMYNNHAVNANTLFDNNARDLYSASGYRRSHIVRSIADTGQLQGESAQTQRDFIAYAVANAKAGGDKAYTDAAIRATIDARRNGVVSLNEIYDPKTPYGYAQDQNLKNLGRAVAVLSVGNIKSNGNVIVRLSNGKRVEVPKEALVRGSDGKVEINRRYLERARADGKQYIDTIKPENRPFNQELENLNKKLASDAQLSQINAGQGEKIAGKGAKTLLHDSPRLEAQHGGKAEDWSKIRSDSYKRSDGTTQEIHAYENKSIGKVVEHKTKIQGTAK